MSARLFFCIRESDISAVTFLKPCNTFFLIGEQHFTLYLVRHMLRIFTHSIVFPMNLAGEMSKNNINYWLKKPAHYSPKKPCWTGKWQRKEMGAQSGSIMGMWNHLFSHDI